MNHTCFGGPLDGKHLDVPDDLPFGVPLPVETSFDMASRAMYVLAHDGLLHFVGRVPVAMTDVPQDMVDIYLRLAPHLEQLDAFARQCHDPPPDFHAYGWEVRRMKSEEWRQLQERGKKPE